MAMWLLAKGIIAADDASRQRLWGKKDFLVLIIDKSPSAKADAAITSRRMSWMKAVN